MMGDVTWQPGITLVQMHQMVIQKALAYYPNVAATAAALGIDEEEMREFLAESSGDVAPDRPEEVTAETLQAEEAAKTPPEPKPVPPPQHPKPGDGPKPLAKPQHTHQGKNGNKR